MRVNGAPPGRRGGRLVGGPDPRERDRGVAGDWGGTGMGGVWIVSPLGPVMPACTG